MSVDQGASRNRHVVPVDDVVDRFRMVDGLDTAEEVAGQLEGSRQAPGLELGHGGVMTAAQGGHRPQAVIGRQVGKQDHVVIDKTPLGKDLLREAGRDL